MATSSLSKCPYRCGSWKGFPVNFMQTLLSCGQICKFYKAVASRDPGKKENRDREWLKILFPDETLSLGLKKEKNVSLIGAHVAFVPCQIPAQNQFTNLNIRTINPG